MNKLIKVLLFTWLLLITLTQSVMLHTQISIVHTMAGIVMDVGHLQRK